MYRPVIYHNVLNTLILLAANLHNVAFGFP